MLLASRTPRRCARAASRCAASMQRAASLRRPRRAVEPRHRRRARRCSSPAPRPARSGGSAGVPSGSETPSRESFQPWLSQPPRRVLRWYSTKPSPSLSPHSLDPAQRALGAPAAAARRRRGRRSSVRYSASRMSEERRRVDAAVVRRVRHLAGRAPSRRAGARGGSCPAPPRAKSSTFFPWWRGEEEQRLAGDVGVHQQRLEPGDQRVAPERRGVPGDAGGDHPAAFPEDGQRFQVGDGLRQRPVERLFVGLDPGARVRPLAVVGAGAGKPLVEPARRGRLRSRVRAREEPARLGLLAERAADGSRAAGPHRPPRGPRCRSGPRASKARRAAPGWRLVRPEMELEPRAPALDAVRRREGKNTSVR